MGLYPEVIGLFASAFLCHCKPRSHEPGILFFQIPKVPVYAQIRPALYPGRRACGTFVLMTLIWFNITAYISWL